VSDFKVTRIKKKSVFLAFKKMLQILDYKRTMSINIYLRQIKMSHENFIQSIINGNHKEIENLSGLKSISPDQTEVSTKLSLRQGPKKTPKIRL
jgi:hypothetical protein